MSKNTWRKITSLTALNAFVFLILTSVILYIVPQGRIAYWANWRLWGLSKTDWTNIHINLGVLFLLSILLHIYFNWKPMISYLKNKARQLRILTREFNIALVVTAVFIIGTLLMLPPFGWVIDVNEALKSAAAQRYGEPPYGHAELSSLAVFAKKTGLDVKQAKTRLAEAGIEPTSNQETIQQISERYGLSPKQLSALMAPAEAGDAASKAFPENPPAGFGRQTLTTIAETYQLDTGKLIQALSEHGVTAQPSLSVRDIADANARSAMDIFEIIKQTAYAR